MQPLVSVIVPVYNVEKYVSECLTSVIGQTYQNLEILIVDDRGNDRSMEIARRFTADPRVRIVRHEKNRGLGPARNTGMSEARGTYIYFVDSDDWIDSCAVEALVEVAERTGSDIVSSSALAFADESAEDLKEYVEKTNQWLCSCSDTRAVQRLSIGHALGQVSVAWAKLYRKSFLERNAIRFVDAKLAHEDVGFYQKCLANSPLVAFTESKSYHYRIRRGSIMQSHPDRGQNWIDFKAVILDAENYMSARRMDPGLVQKMRDQYRHLFVNHCGPFSWYFGYEEQVIRLCGIALYRLVRRDGHGKFKLLGITLRRW